MMINIFGLVFLLPISCKESRFNCGVKSTILCEKNVTSRTTRNMKIFHLMVNIFNEFLGLSWPLSLSLSSSCVSLKRDDDDGFDIGPGEGESIVNS
jgi:hypothetical protein